MRGRRAKLTLSHDTARARAAFLRVAETVAGVTGVSLGDIILPAPVGRMRRDRAFARQAAIYLTITRFDVPAARLARALKRPRWKMSLACQRAELGRDNHSFDQLMARLEDML